MIYFTSDTHFGHSAVIKYANRPFESVEHMDSELIKNWNERVTDNDEIIFLGDFCFKGKAYAENILKQLKGRKYFIRGNHDKRFSDNFLLKYFVWVKDYVVLHHVDARIVLSHYPLRTWDRIHHGTWHLYGHSHGNMTVDIQPSLDVGVDCWNYRPVSLDEVKEKLKDVKYTVTDHHARKEDKQC